MNIFQYKYKVSIKTIFLSGFIAVITSMMFISAVFIPFNDKFQATFRDIFFTVIYSIVCFLIASKMIFDFWIDFSIFQENRRNPNITIDEESIYLPFEENKKRVRIFFCDIKACQESYTSHKKKKIFFIYISSKLNKDDEYRLYKECMNPSDYEQLKDILLKQTKSKK